MDGYRIIKAQSRVRALDREIAEEQAIADALSTYADGHQRTVFTLERERDAIITAIEAPS